MALNNSFNPTSHSTWSNLINHSLNQPNQLLFPQYAIFINFDAIFIKYIKRPLIKLH